jgi:hypothetical protein
MSDSDIPALDRSKGVEAIRLLAGRLARRAHLRKYCSADHQVLEIEEELIEMATSKLRAFILSSFSRDEILLLRQPVEKAIRDFAAQKALSYDDDPSTVDSIADACSAEISPILFQAHQ